MIIDGKSLALEILAGLKKEVDLLVVKPHLTVFTCAPNFETKKFLALKQKRAADIGLFVSVVDLPDSSTTENITEMINECLPTTDGVVVQLPFPNHIDMAAVLAAVPSAYDVDAIGYAGEETNILPPVVGAIDVIAGRQAVDWVDKNVVVVGQGRLVGVPAALYASARGAMVTVLKKDTHDNDHKIAQADILILGAGVPGLVTADMVKAGVVVFDAGTSEEGGMIVGDAATDVTAKASLLTPVPGGIGPLTIAILLKNVLELAKLHSRSR